MRILLSAMALWLSVVPAVQAAGLVLASHGPSQEYLPEEPVAVIEAPQETVREPRVLIPDAQGPMVFEGPVGGVVSKGLRPAYRVAEGAADVVYDLIRRRLFGSLLPGQLTREMGRAPDHDSYAAYEKALKRKEERFASRMLQRYPRESLTAIHGGLDRESRLREWRGWAREEQQAVLVSAFEDALLSRYGLDRFGQDSEQYARERRHWDPGFLMGAGLIGGTFAYMNGIQADPKIGPLRAQIGLRAGYRILDSIAAGGRHRFGHVQVAYRDVPVYAAVEWAVNDGRVVRDVYGLRYEKRF